MLDTPMFFIYVEQFQFLICKKRDICFYYYDESNYDIEHSIEVCFFLQIILQIGQVKGIAVSKKNCGVGDEGSAAKIEI